MKISIALVVFFLCGAGASILTGTTISTDITDPTDPRRLWTSGGNPYVIAPTSGTTITVGSAVTLTIQPGVVAQFNSGVSLVIQGTLSADASSGGSIQFTSNGAPTAGFWGSLRIDGGSGHVLKNCTVQAATDGLYIPNHTTNVTVNNCTFNMNTVGLYIANHSTNVTVDNCTFTTNTVPIKVNPDSGTGIESTNTFTGNTNNHIEVVAPAFALSSVRRNATWKKPSATATVPYFIPADIIVNDLNSPNPITLTITTGVELQFNTAPAAGLRIGSGTGYYPGRLVAVGGAAPADRIVFTRRGGTGYWKGLFVEYDEGYLQKNQLTLTACDLRYGGVAWDGTADPPRGNLVLSGMDALRITNCKIENSAWAGVWINQSCHVAIEGCTIQNNTMHGVYVKGNGRAQILCSVITGHNQSGGAGVFANTASPVIHHADLTNNTTGVKHENNNPTLTTRVNARHNWWGGGTASTSGSVDTAPLRTASMGDLVVCSQGLPRWKRDYIYTNGQLTNIEERSP